MNVSKHPLFASYCLVVPARILSSPSAVSLDEGETITLSCNIDGIPAPTATWSCNGVPVVNDDRHEIKITPDTVTLIIPKSQESDSATYTLNVDNDIGSDNVHVTVTIKGRFGSMMYFQNNYL